MMEEENESDEEEDIVFEKAREFLRLVQSRTFVVEEQLSPPAEIPTNFAERKMVQFGVHKTKKFEISAKTTSITSSQRRKLERVKTPVTSFRKPPSPYGLSEKEKGESVLKMLEHIRRMPKQETYIPAPIPMVFINKQSCDKDVSERSSHAVEFSYLTSEQDLATWKLLRSSPKNCNVFVGNLSYKVNESLLVVTFQPFIVEEQQKHLKVRIVVDSVSGTSRGYGFVQFPYRRATELAVICMQRFEMFGHEMQLGWGQEEPRNVLQPAEDTLKKKNTRDKKNVGVVISDSCIFQTTPGVHGEKKARKTRWDVSDTRRAKHPTKKNLAKIQSNFSNINETLRKDKKMLKGTIEEDGLLESPDHSSSKTNFTNGVRLNRSDSDTRITEKEKRKTFLRSEFHSPGEQNVHKRDTVSNTEVHLTLDHKTTTGKGTDSKEQCNSIEFVEKYGLSADQHLSVDARRTSSDKPIEWLRREQRAKMIQAVCQNLRNHGVKHHLGVFGTHFEADNSRLFVIFCKQLTEKQLKNEFEEYGTVAININKDSSGFCKGSAIVQYVSSASAETASKKLHGKMLGSKPLMIKIAEPKRTHKAGQNVKLK